MNKLAIFGLVFIGTICSCTNSKELSSTQSENFENVKFTEERRLNHTINLAEITIINTLADLTELYGNLQDPDLPRSAPIPPFDEKNEFILVLKPEMNANTFKDIEIENVQKSGNQLIVNYREVENAEYAENKWNDPIVILKVTGKESEIQINKIN